MREALVNPDMLQWARRRAALTVEKAAEKLKIVPEKLRAWESGKARPSLSQAMQLARAVSSPFGYLYLSSPPQQPTPIPDLRTVSDRSRRNLSVDFREQINDVLRKQEWYKGHLAEEGAPPLDFVGLYNTSDDFRVVASDIRQRLELTDNVLGDVTSWGEYLRLLINRSEDIGVVVIRSGIVKNNTRRQLSIEEFRGFALCDRIAPLVFINARDATVAKIFTLLHELAHIWIGQSGITNLDPGAAAPVDGQPIERYCNQVAAEALVPAVSFAKEWMLSDETIEQEVERLSRRFRVGSMVILRRAFELELISEQEFFDHAEVLKKRSVKKKKGQAGGDYYRSLIARNGKNLTTAVVASALEGRTLYREAASILGIQPPKIQDAAQFLGLQ
jgi:Zn-dependent peptidase ImmA (M78 family)/DNA-binding XRE family transcriptional regulator